MHSQSPIPRAPAERASYAETTPHRASATTADLRYTVMGPIEFIDYGGLDIAYYGCHYMAKALDSPRHGPPPELDALMRAGKRGLREGEGYYDWRGTDTDAYRRERFAQFVKLFGQLGEMPKPVV